MTKFLEFVDKKQRDAVHQLKIIKQMLEQHDFDVDGYLDTENPYIFVKSPNSSLSFGGVRIYKVGDTIAYRVQKDKRTHPYGKAYNLDLEEMYNDLLSDDMDPQKAGTQVIKAVINELKKFFENSKKAEKELQDMEFDADKDPLGKVMVRPNTLDYSSMIHSKS